MELMARNKINKWDAFYDRLPPSGKEKHVYSMHEGWEFFSKYHWIFIVNKIFAPFVFPFRSEF